MTERPTNLRLDDQLCFALYAATNAVVRAYRPLLHHIGLNYPQYLVILVLWQDGEQAVHQIAARGALPAHALSPLVHRLQRAGLVRLRREPPDRRVVHVQLTAAGEALHAAAAEAQRTVACQTRLPPRGLDDCATSCTPWSTRWPHRPPNGARYPIRPKEPRHD
ncbi:MAG: MarR family winged helix-turn-helix transcriptional regulator [Geodermatophilaceae bacterium]